MRQPALKLDAAATGIALRRFLRPDSRIDLARHAKHAAALALEILILAALLLLFFVRVPEVSGHSMEPQLSAGDHVLINTLAFDVRIGPWRLAHLRDIRRGEIVAFSHDVGGSRETYLKRVVGLPGDQVAFRRGSLFVNGAPVAESYAIRRDGTTLAAQRLGADRVYVLGDNRADSDDSRTFGAVPIAEVMGRAAFICWPPGRGKRIR